MVGRFLMSRQSNYHSCIQADNLSDVGEVLQEADDDLEMFRSQWKRELDSHKTEAAAGSVNVEVQQAEEDIEQRVGG